MIPEEKINEAAEEYADEIWPLASSVSAPYTTTGDLWDLASDSFKKGVEFAESQTLWISVNDRLPEDSDDEKYFLFVVFTQNRIIMSEYFKWKDIKTFRGYALKYDYTHWMYIPTPPQI
jgi:hypothetical protein